MPVYKSVRRYKIDEITGCWNWTGNLQSRGYGHFAVRRKTIIAHRYFYEFYFGKIPEGLQIDHKCNNKICVNPYHLQAVTSQENLFKVDSTAQANLNRKKTHCKHGHLLQGDNLYITPNGRRNCKHCRSLASWKLRWSI